MLSGAAYAAACSADGDCTEANQVCDQTCKCSDAAFRNNAGSACDLSRFYNRIIKTEWINEPSLNIRLQRPECCSTPVLLPWKIYCCPCRQPTNTIVFVYKLHYIHCLIAEVSILTVELATLHIPWSHIQKRTSRSAIGLGFFVPGDFQSNTKN